MYLRHTLISPAVRTSLSGRRTSNSWRVSASYVDGTAAASETRVGKRRVVLANISEMRLTPHEREVIRRLGLRHLGRAPRLFGSRLDDARRGGDVDLLIATDLPPGQAARRRTELLADLWLELGERKIDIVMRLAARTAALIDCTMDFAVETVMALGLPLKSAEAWRHSVPRCLRIFPITCCSSVAEMICSPAAPQFGQCCMSMLKAKLQRSAGRSSDPC